MKEISLQAPFGLSGKFVLVPLIWVYSPVQFLQPLAEAAPRLYPACSEGPLTQKGQHAVCLGFEGDLRVF
jgi:hypothetical protein